MTPEDPRHGTAAGYVAGCGDACCKAGIARWTAQYRIRRYIDGPCLVDDTGTVRRIRALMALGWPGDELDRRIGRCGGYSANVQHRSKGRVRRSTALLYMRVYQQLSMTPGPSTKTRRRAVAAGWAPPLAWDDETIDDRTARPRLGARGARKTLDEAVVVRLLDGERVTSTRLEREEAMRRWIATGRSEKSLCDLHDWRAGRYSPRQAGAA